jgi:hypothetical protein
MVGVLLILLVFLAVGLVLVWPKLAAYLVWPVVFVYPHLYLNRMELLPWNIGIDDIFICVTAVIVIVRCNLLGGRPLRFGLALIGVLGYVIVWTVAHLSGWSIMPDLLPVDVLKPVLKAFVFVLFVYLLVHLIDDERDLRRISVVYVLTFTAAGVTVILHQLFPDQMLIFASGKEELYQRWFGEAPRAVGSLMNPNTGAVVLAMAAVFAIRMMTLTPSAFGKLGLLVCVAIMGGAMVLTESRTGAAALVVVLLAMVVGSRSRLTAAGILAFGVLAILVRPALFMDFQERIQAAYNPEAGQFDAGVQARIDTWAEYWRQSTPQVWLLGQGQLVPTMQFGYHAHSSYVSALLVHGIGGLAWFILFFGTLARRGWRSVRIANEPVRTICAAVLWGLAIWAIAGLALDLLVTFNPRYVVFFYAVLIERGSALARRAPVRSDSQVAHVPHAGLPQGAANRFLIPHAEAPT